MSGTLHGRHLSLLVVDDHRIFAEVLSMRLMREPGVDEVRVAYGLDEAKVLSHRSPPDVVVLDYELEGQPGPLLIEELNDLPVPPPVLMLSASSSSKDIVDALGAGAAGWVLKGTQVDVLLSAIEEVLEGRTYLDPTTVRPVVQHLLRDNRSRSEHSFVDDLPRRQVEVLRCLVSGLSRAEIAERLYISANTVRTHVQHLLHASGEHSTLALVSRARALGVPGIDAPGDRGRPSSR